ncbi:MAG: D-alanyl-D-alanine carboxypeptidase [Clostridiales bacterium]|nr:D-alanyl-D-alanine carboxypeptidase [Clostridiales bacterium]
MKKIASIVLGVASFGFVATGAQFYAKNSLKIAQAVAEAVTMDEKPAKDVLDISAKSAYLMDNYSKTAIYAHKEEERLPIASMCKIMTLLLSFDAIRAGNLSFEEEISVSERAASMGGSQVFLEANAKYSVKNLIKSVVICSANDSCVALAERIAGSEQVFVDRMNAKAKEIGANNTLFANCTGLPKEPQYSCAKDVALMLSKLLENEEYYEFGKVWMDKFEHPEGRYTEITNTNKLIRFYDGCDGGKTGFTNEAGFCLAATAKRDNTRIISVVIGEKDSKQRFNDVRTMFDYAFANYTTKKIVQADVPLEERATVDGGKSKSIAVAPQRDAYFFLRRGEQGDITSEISLKTVKAPCKKGDVVGVLRIYQAGVEMDSVPLVAYENVKEANFFDCLQEVAEEWNKR